MAVAGIVTDKVEGFEVERFDITAIDAEQKYHIHVHAMHHWLEK